MTATSTNPTVWVDGDPLMEAIAAAVWEQCSTEGTSLVVDDPRNIAAVATAVARTYGAYSATELEAAQADVALLDAEFPDETKDGNGWPGDEHAEPGTRGWTA